MSRRVPLRHLRRLVLLALGDEWRTPSDLEDAFHAAGYRFGGTGWYKIALTLERLANDGLAEIRIRGNRRTFRRAS